MIGRGDFLDRLAIRQVSPSVGLQPRLPSRFADRGSSGLVEEGGLAAAPRPADVQGGPMNEPMSAARGRPEDLSVGISPLAPVRVAEPHTGDAPAPEVAPPASLGDAALPPTPAPAEPPRPRRSEEGAHRLESAIVAIPDATHAPPEPVRAPERLAPVAEAAPAAGHERSDLLVAPRREVPAVPAVPQPAAPHSGRMDQGPPEVTVSIGRIEVRAIADAAPTAPPRLRPAERRPTLSLDEYLERRHGTGRR